LKILASTLVLIFLYLGYKLHTLLPWHISWDMDLITVIDLYRLSDGLIPLHINHTALGLYLPLRWGWYLLPIETNYQAWISSAVPIIPLAKTVAWVRLLIIPASAATCFFAAASVRNIVFLMVTLSMASIWLMQIQIIRTELFSVMWFSLAFAVLYRLPRKYIWMAFLAAGLGFLTKIQGVFLAAGFVLACIGTTTDKDYLQLPKREIAFPIMAVFLVLSLGAWMTYIPSSFATFSKLTAPNYFFALSLILLGFPFFRNPYLRTLAPAYWFVVGLMGSFLFHFALFIDLSTSLEYLLIDWKMVFIRFFKPAIAADRAENIFFYSIKYHSALFAAWILWMGFSWKSLALRGKLTTSAYFCLILASMRFATRGGIQDALWTDFLILYGFGLGYPLSKIVQYGILLALLISNFVTIYGTKNIVFKSAPRNIDHFWKEPYESPEILYTERMSNFETSREEINKEIERLGL
jgi:hypothetical protein